MKRNVCLRTSVRYLAGGLVAVALLMLVQRLLHGVVAFALTATVFLLLVWWAR